MKKNIDLNHLIPGGAHTYSKGDDQFPSNVPKILYKGEGAYVYDLKLKKILDYGLGLRTVGLGYSNFDINKFVVKAIYKGNNLTRPSLLEYQAAKVFLNLIDSAEMVKFTKNGSSAVTAAIKLARAYNNKEIILIAKEHPFFSYDDWFIASTNLKRGIPKALFKYTKTFKYNDISSFNKQILKYRNQISCVILEPSTDVCPKIYSKNKDDEKACCSHFPCSRDYKNNNNFLKKVQKICKKNNLKGAQYDFGVDPDLSTFGKAMANGFSIAALCGKKKIMRLGGISDKGKERVFLLSTTHGAEMSSLAAFIATTKFYIKNKVINHNWKYGSLLIKEANKISKKIGILEYFYFTGPGYSPKIVCLNKKKKECLKLRTLFLYYMMKNNILMPYVAISYMHKKHEFILTLKAIEKTLIIYKKALQLGTNSFLSGQIIKPVFRKFN